MDLFIGDSDDYFTASDGDSILFSDGSYDLEMTGPQTMAAITRHTIDPDATRTPPPLCIICGTRPQYSNGSKSYPTCGLACAAKLKDIPNGPGTNPSTDMCVVCHVRPKYSGGGKSYPTCGLTCAAKLDSGSGPVRMCDYCHRRPRFFDGKKTYPQCGRTCRDKARGLAVSRNIGAPTYTAGNNSSCLMCWKAHQGGDSQFCGRSCSDEAAHRAPLLLEAPRGHVTFGQIANSFQTSWGRWGAPSPEVKKVYKIIQKPVYAANYDRYRVQVDPNGSSSSGKANEFRRWHGLVRDCDIGCGGNVKPCSSKICTLCQILQSTFDAAWYPGGAIHSSITSDEADKHSKSPRQYSSKAMFLVNVAAGRAMKVAPSELQASLGVPPAYNSVEALSSVSGGVPRGYDSVKVLSSRDGKSVIEDLIVYTGDAVRPSYLVIYG